MPGLIEVRHLPAKMRRKEPATTRNGLESGTRQRIHRFYTGLQDLAYVGSPHPRTEM